MRNQTPVYSYIFDLIRHLQHCIQEKNGQSKGISSLSVVREKGDTEELWGCWVGDGRMQRKWLSGQRVVDVY